MAHHFTKGTVEASIWCRRCSKMTQWRILHGRRAYCIPCYRRGGEAEKKDAPPPNPEAQMNLFSK